MTIAEVPLYDLKGKELKRLKVDGRVTDVEINHPLLTQVLVMFQANQRQGTHETKTRGEVSGGGKKPWRQKGTGRARAGSNRSPLWRHGGTTFGPHPRDYSAKIPKQWREQALLMGLKAKAQDNRLLLVEPILVTQSKTKEVASVIKALPVKGKTLLVVSKMTDPLKRAARNIPYLLVKSQKDVSAYDVLRHRSLVLEEAAFESLVKGTTA